MNPLTALHARCAIAGAILSVLWMSMTGAADTGPNQISSLPQRFLILVSRLNPGDSEDYQSHWLRVCPHYGKIDSNSLKHRIVHETKDFAMIVTVEAGQEFQRGNVIAFDTLQHTQLAPGSSSVRHLESGKHEMIP